MVGGGRSQEQALSLPLLDGGRAENRPDCFIKHCLEASLRERGALQVFDGTCGNTASPSDRDAVAPPPGQSTEGPTWRGQPRRQVGLPQLGLQPPPRKRKRTRDDGGLIPISLAMAKPCG